MTSNGGTQPDIARPSMAVDKNNTKLLTSRFEQLQSVVTSGNNVRARRGHTFGGTKGGDKEFEESSSTSSGTVSNASSSATDVANSSFFKSVDSGKVATTPAKTATIRHSPSGTNATPASKIASPTPSKWTVKVATPLSKGANTAKIDDSDSIRTQPHVKPKPDPMRASVFLGHKDTSLASAPISVLINTPVKNSSTSSTANTSTTSNSAYPSTANPPAPTPVKTTTTQQVTSPKPQEPTPKPQEPTPLPRDTQKESPRPKESPGREATVSVSFMPSESTQSVSLQSGVLQISEKWRISYDELEFADLVSSGSAGEVYLGYYFGTPVAIKKLFLAVDQKHLVAREFVMLQEVNHPNVVQFLGICDHSSGIYLITEYVEHGDLFDLLVFGDSDIGWKNKVKIGLQTAQAVFYLHSRNIIHRDLKSQNILIGENYKVKLCDLGLATVIENKKRMTMCGTNEWMAPEINFEETYDNKVDVFSFGIVLTEMITNKPPRKRDIMKKLAFDVNAFLDSIPEDTPKELVELVIDCCKSDPKQRPSMKECVTRLRNIATSLAD